MPGKNKGKSGGGLVTAADYMSVWTYLDAEARAKGAD